MPLIIFFLIYSIRLVDDVLFKGILLIYQTPFYTLGYYFGLTVLPVLAIALLYRPQDNRTIFRHLLASLVIANVLLFLYSVIYGDFGRGGAFSGRIQAASEIEGAAVLGPIWIGMMGALLASLLFGVFTARQGLSKVKIMVGTGLLGLSAANLLFGASRGPVLGLVLAVLVFLFRPGSNIPGIRKIVSRGKAWVAALWIVGIAIILIASSDGTVFLVERFISLYTDRIVGGGGVIEERDIIYATAWQDFLSSPLFGTSYVVSYKNSQPHNFILESLIATGIVGTFFFFIALFRAFKGISRLLDGMHGIEGVSLALVTVSTLGMGLTSSSISQSPHLWILVALVTVMGTRVRFPKRHIVAQTGISR